MPNGYPQEITPDYLPYQLWTLPTHITGWIGNSLVTSSLLKAAGLGTGAVGTVAAGATIKWIAKDGIGALGRYIVGGSLARYFDEDPRFWRFLADLIVTCWLCAGDRHRSQPPICSCFLQAVATLLRCARACSSRLRHMCTAACIKDQMPLLPCGTCTLLYAHQAYAPLLSCWHMPAHQ